MTSNGPISRGTRPSSALLRAKEIPGFNLGDRVDVRGWTVYASDATLVGSVASLFVDMHTRAVRYLGVSLVDSRTNLPDGMVLVPIGSASRPVGRRVVVLNTLSSLQLASAPRVPNRPVTEADENAVLAVYGMEIAHNAGTERYGGPMFAEHRLFGGARGTRAAR